MKNLLLIIMVFISFSVKAQNPIAEAKEYGQQIKAEIEKVDMTKPFPKQLIEKIVIFHKKIEDLREKNFLGVCDVVCGAQYAYCISSCGGSVECLIACSFQRDFCVLNCN